MRSNSAVVMPDSLKVSAFAVAIGLQLVAFWIASSVGSLVNFSTENFLSNYFDVPPAIEQVTHIYQPPFFIGSPSTTMGSGTR